MKLTDAEWHIMNALWRQHPATARQVLRGLPGRVQWAYTTVKTMLTRLVAKGAIAEHKEGRTSHYEPLLSRANARRGALVNLADRAFDGAFGPLMHFMVEDRRLSASERDQLKQLLRDEEGACSSEGGDR